MTLLNEWEELTQTQTKESFPDFWKEYCDAEAAIYADVLSNSDGSYSGKLGEMAEKYNVRPVIFMGFLDGIQDSLNKPFDLKDFDEESEFDLDIDFEKLLFNMHKADAKHLYGLEEWNKVFDEDKQEEIAKQYKKSKTVVKPKKIGRNDPCPCGSGKKYKHCCGRSA